MRSREDQRRRGPQRRWRRPLATAIAAFAGCGALAVGTASGHPGTPHGHTTLEQIIRPVGPADGYRSLATRPGEPYIVRQDLGRARSSRASRRGTLSFFGQLTDPQIVDEMSPARAEIFEPIGGPVSSAHRPQEAFGPYVWDQAVRNLNANLTSDVPQGNGERARVQLSLLTGDLADNQQLNEVVWYRDVLLGRTVDPFSGKPLSPSNQCLQAITPAQQAELNERVARREYTGVQDYDDYPGPKQKHPDFWDPDEQAPAGSSYRPFPEYPGLMNRAQIRFDSQGMRTPWYVARGNHDGLVQGNLPANPAFNEAATSCEKLYPSPAAAATTRTREGKVGDPKLPPDAIRPQGEVFGQGLFPGTNTALTPPDPDRRFVTKSEFKALQGGGDNQHGFGFVDPAENAASNGTASYYGFNRPAGMRFVSIDSVAEGGGDRGNLDDPQYRWLERELDRNSSREFAPDGSLRRDGDPDRLIVVFGHHTLESMDNPNTDETAGACPAGGPGCDADPRPSTPVHQGTSGPQPVRDLFLRYPNMIAYVAGHTHRSDVTPYGRLGRGFWEINTPSLVDPAQQLRTVEVMNNRDGTLSLFGTILDHSAPVRPPAPGNASSFTPRQMSALSRELSFNDPQVDPSEGLGQRIDRNVELLLDDPRSGAPPAPRGRIVGTEGNDVINGTSGDDVIECGGGNDTVNAGAGDDIVRCGPGNDVVRGGSGHDSLFGQDGNDRLFGESGNDHHDGGPGSDRAVGGSGADTFVGVEESVQD